MRILLPAVMLLLAPLSTSQATVHSIAAPDLLTPMTGVVDPGPKLGTKRSQPVHVDIALLRRARIGHMIRVRMFADAVFTLKLEDLEIEPFVENTFHWRGSVVGRAGSCFVLTVHEDAFAGWIFPNNPKFQSLSIQGAPGMYVARELVDDVHQGTVMPVPAHMRRSGVLSSSACNDNPDQIDLLLVYGAAAQAQAGSGARARAAIAAAVAQANTICSRSAMTMRFRAKSIEYINYATSGNQGTDLRRLTDTSDGFMDSVHARRRALNADLVAYIRGGSGGTAWCFHSWGLGFSVTGLASLGAMTLAHELGHNLACGHDPANNTPGNRCTNTAYGRGHNFLYDTTLLVRSYAYTVMSYSSNWGDCSFPWVCQKARLPNFSSPLVRLRFGSALFPTGTASRDNRRTILEFRQRVANFSRSATNANRLPSIRRSPSSVRLNLGYHNGGTVMSCAATGHVNSIKYQWRRNRRNVAGATSSTLRLGSEITAAMAGSYDCAVTSCAGTVYTNPATLSVGPERVLRKGAVPPSGAWNVVENIGDVDGDGYDEFVNALPTSGRSWVTVWNGKTHDFFMSISYGTGLHAGYSATGADIDGDGFSDLILGMPSRNSNQGAIAYIRGSDLKAKRTTTRLLAVGAAGSRLGERITAANLDAAANIDIAVAGRDQLTAYSSTGRKLWSVKPAPGTFINGLDTVGDVNSDGYDDLILGLPSYLSNRGRWELRSGRNGALLRSWNGSAGEQRGAAVCGIGGDVDGDGVNDFVSASPPYTGRGLVQFWSGRTGQFIRSRWGSSGDKLWGRWVSRIGDYNSDGFVDVLVGAKGYCSVMSGKDSSILRTITGTNDDFGLRVAGLHSDGDVRGDILVVEAKKAWWKYDRAPTASPPKWFAYGRTCAGTGGKLPRIGLSGPLPRLGGTISVTLTGGRSNSAAICRLAGSTANIPLDAFGITGCSLLVQNTLANFVTPTDGGGSSKFGPMQISSELRWLGADLNWQWLVLDPGGNAFGLTLSDAAEWTIGAK